MYYFVLFKADWCGHCQNFIKNQLPKIKQYINNKSKYYKLLIYDADTNAKIIQQQRVDGFPTIRLYSGTVKNPLQKIVNEFNNREANYIIKVLDGFIKKISGNSGNEHFTPSIISSKGITYSSYYENNNGVVKGKKVQSTFLGDGLHPSIQEERMVCDGNTCRRVSRIIDEHGKIKESHQVVPYNDFDSVYKTYYDTSLELRNHF